jgi:hypothetical protein
MVLKKLHVKKQVVLEELQLLLLKNKSNYLTFV